MNLLQIILIIAVGVLMAIVDVMPYMNSYKGKKDNEEEKEIGSK
ncbi:hypothetical protein [Clostridium sp.]